MNHRHTRTGFARPLAAPSGLGLRPRATRPLRGGRISARHDSEWRKRKRRESALVCGSKQGYDWPGATTSNGSLETLGIRHILGGVQ